MPKTLKAAVLFSPGTDLEICELNIPSLLSGQVFVKIIYSGICRSQLMEVNGLRGEDKWLPHLLGHEAYGIVEKIGPNVSKVKPGDEVVISWIKGEGIDAPGPTFDKDGIQINAGPVTTFSNYSIISENRLCQRPIGMPDKLASFFGCAVPTGSGMVLCQAKPKRSDKVVVLGIGGIGLSVILALKSLKVSEIVVVEVDEKKIQLAYQLGIKKVVNAKESKHFQSFLNEHSSCYDYCFECTGLTSSIQTGFELVKFSGGKVFFASHPAFGEKISLDPHDLIKGKQIFGSWGGGRQT